MVRVCVGSGSDTFTDEVHGERKQEMRLYLARLERGVLGREGQALSLRGGCQVLLV